MEETDNELIAADISRSVPKLVCIEYPGVVENESAAIERLGGIKSLAKAHSDGRRLELRFRPSDQYCKPALSKAVVGSNLILKIKRRRIFPQPSNEVEHDDSHSDLLSSAKYEYSAELVGICNKLYQFSGMADYQVLPPGLNSIKYKGMSVNPNDFQVKEPLDDSFFTRDVPSFLPPSCFSKVDKPISYVYRPYSKSKPTSTEEGGTELSLSRSRKFNLVYSVSFDSMGVPKEPKPDAVTSINTSNPLISQIKELFEEKPIWSRMALQWRLKTNQIRIRGVLPLVAYTFSSGPFKRLWIKLSYDPRKDPSSKIYQSLDIRVPKEVTVIGPQNRVKPAGPSSLSGEIACSTDHVEEVTFTFLPDKLPNQRQLFYQLCDIQDPEGQELIHNNDGKEVECTEVNGWCDENLYDQLRKLLTSKIKLLAEKMSAVEPHST